MVINNIRNGSLVLLINGKYYIALVGGVYGTPGVLHQVDGYGCQTLEDLQEYRVEAIFEMKRASCGIAEMEEIAKGVAPFSRYAEEIYRKCPVKEMTVAEIEKALGYPVKIIKEDKAR